MTPNNTNLLVWDKTALTASLISRHIICSLQQRLQQLATHHQNAKKNKYQKIRSPFCPSTKWWNHCSWASLMIVSFNGCGLYRMWQPDWSSGRVYVTTCCCCDSPAALLLSSAVQVEEVCNRSRVVPQVLQTFKRWDIGWWSSKNSVWYKIRFCNYITPITWGIRLTAHLI